MTDLVTVRDEGPVRIVRMNRPEKKNALTEAMYSALAGAIEEYGHRPALHCLIIGATPAGFCAGNDLHDFQSAIVGGVGLGQPVLRFLYALARCEKPLVAAVCGAAVGVGVTMLMHCDHVVCSEDARFSTPFVRLGLTPEAASSLIAPRLMGHARAFSLLVMGRALDAAQAQAAGIVNAVVAAAQVDAVAMQAAAEIAALPAASVVGARRLMRGDADAIVARIDAEAGVFKAQLATPQARAAIEAFFARRK
ncbi:MAG: enoyl-CoA hydratase/isomerase family protein [Proteobacteria bacterium]|nr:enoyl-CoA hydratase/isomerase family protein [Pseudomonadota bacterium]